MTASSNLRIGFVYERPLQSWIARAIELTAELGTVAEVVAISVPPAPADPAAFALYARADRAVLGRTCSAATEADVPGADTVSARESDAAGLPNLVDGLELDVLVNLTSGSLPEVNTRHGIWELRHGTVRAAASHAVLTEFAAGSGACTTTVTRAVEGGERCLYRTRSLVRRLSLARARDPIQWKAAVLVARILRDGVPADGAFVLPRSDAEPRTGRVVALTARLLRRAIGHLMRRVLYRPTWTIAWRPAISRSRTASEFGPHRRFDPPNTHFHADPFLIAEDGRHFLFYESWINALGRAELAVVELSEAGASAPRTVLERPYHLSYPFVFRWQGEHFMIPESADSGLVQLFRATSFPYEWELDSVLLEGIEAYDATLATVDGVCFLFAAMREPGADIDELHVFSSADLRGPYIPHPLNPVVSDVACARPAGRLFADGDRLIRPGQDGVGGYGRAVVLNEIVRLTRDEYWEVPGQIIDASWAPDGLGTHTVDHDGDIEVMDLRLERSRLALPLRPGRVKVAR